MYALGGESPGPAPGSTPIVNPPASRAPRLAASMTPERPPVSSAAPRSAIERPTARATSAIWSSHAAGPITPMTGRCAGCEGISFELNAKVAAHERQDDVE